MNKHNAEAPNCRDQEPAFQMPYIAMLFGEDGRRWLGLVSIEEFGRAQIREASSDGGTNKFRIEGLSFEEIYAGEGPAARIFGAPLRQRPVYP